MAAATAAACLALAATALAVGGDENDQPPISYSSTSADDPVARLQKRIDTGEMRLAWTADHGYLPAVLRALGIPFSSQTLVFSKTSFQRDRIAPQTPRAIYFNDHTYAGWVQGGPVVEISTTDPRLGGVFYTLAQDPGVRPRFVRQSHECLSCHASTLTRGVPGHIMRSVFTDAAGQPVLAAGAKLTTDESPLRERWGGWYVTGTHGEQRHMGNQITHSVAQAESGNLEAGANVTDLSRRFDTAPYLTRHSDLTALMVLGHQTDLHNRITRAGYETRRALHYGEIFNREFGRPAGFLSESTRSRIKSVGEPLVHGLLFSGEARLTQPVRGTSNFAKEFPGAGPRDSRGRSLRDLDLQTRLFRYPCSFLIYSEAFRELPAEMRQYVFGRLREILGGRDTSAPFAHLTPADRTALREILTETLPEFAAAP